MLLRAFGLAALAALLALPLWSTQVAAHASYAGSSPAVDAVLATAPADVWVQFSEAITPASTLSVLNEAGVRVDRGDSRRDPANTQRLWVTLNPIGPGRYTVRYDVVSAEDGHAASDSFRFTVAGAASPAPAPAPAPAAPTTPAAGPAPAPIAAAPAAGHADDHQHADTTAVRVISDDAAGPVHSHMKVQRSGDRLRFQIPVSNHLHGPINNLEVHIAAPHGATYLGSATDDGDVAQWDGAVARYYVPWLQEDGRVGPYELDVRVNAPDPHHPHPTLTTRVWLRFQHDGQWMAYTSTLTIENPLEPGAAHGVSASGGGH